MRRIWLMLSMAMPFLFVVTKNEVHFVFSLNHNNQTQVFHYLSQPENFPILNPTIFEIETVHREENEFSVKYGECLSHLPMVTNFGLAHYKITQHEDGYEMVSIHSTCFMGEYFCLPTASRLRLGSVHLSRVLYEEDIKYSCPWILTIFCFEEILFQRMAIMNRLAELFFSDNP